MFRNPPADELEKICHRNAQATFKHAMMAPKVVISDLKVDALGQDIFRLEAIVENQGYLPSNITGWALKMKTARPVTVKLNAPDGVKIVGGMAEVDLGHLAGRSDRTTKYSRFRDWTPHKKKAQWIVQLKGIDAADIEIVMTSRNGGQDRRSVTV